MKRLLTLALLLIPAATLFSKKVINSGHQSPVKFIEYLDQSDTYFSLSEDGTLVIKKSGEEKIYKRFFLTSNDVKSLCLSNKNNQFAIVEANASSNYIISVWDYEKEKKLYSINLDEFPMTIGFTGGGNYLYTTSISSRPVRIFNAKTGAGTSFLNKNKSYVDFMYVGSSEKHALLYSSSGTIEVRDLRTSEVRIKVKTLKNLTDIKVTADKAYLIARNGNSIYLIGRNNGRVYDKKEIRELGFYDLNKTTGELICYVDGKYRKTLEVFEIVSGKFFQNSKQELLIKESLSNLSSSYNIVIYSDDRGNLHKFNRWSNESSIFVENKIKDISGITIIDDIAVLTTEDKIYLFKSQYFSDRTKNTRKLSNFSLKDYISPVLAPKGSKEYNGNLLLWNEDLVYFNIETGEIIFSHKFSSEIIDIKIKDEKLLALDQNGMVKIINLSTYDVEFSFKSPGFTTVSFYSDNEILGGDGASEISSLMILDLKTKETLPFKISLDVIFNIIPSNREDFVYISGLKSGYRGNETHFIEYNLDTKKEKTLLKKGMEVLNSSFIVDDNNYIYTNMGTKSLLKINDKTRSIKPFQTTINKTKYLHHKNNGIYSVNENKSLSIWHPNTGEKIIDFYLFNDREWVAISADSSTAFGSPGASKYISSN